MKSQAERAAKCFEFDRRAAQKAAEDCFHGWAKSPEYEPLPEDLALDLVARLRNIQELQYRRTKSLVSALCSVVEALESSKFALQMMIINFNGNVPGPTPQQVFDGAIDARDKISIVQNNLNAALEKMEGGT